MADPARIVASFHWTERLHHQDATKWCHSIGLDWFIQIVKVIANSVRI